MCCKIGDEDTFIYLFGKVDAAVEQHWVARLQNLFLDTINIIRLDTTPIGAKASNNQRLF